MELASKYNPTDIESKWYQYWLENRFFHSEPDNRDPYTIVIPPPNVTGVLHMGHILNNTIQDVLVRRARMQGKNACWIPGTDHASIATEAKVVAKLAQEGIKKADLTREKFLEHAWEWTDKHGGIILEQLKKLGASCDWDRTAFTMDDLRSESVLKVFVDLFEKGKIYRGVRMVNWDPKALTALSDEEVLFKEQQGKLYYLRYKVVASPKSPLTPKGGTGTHYQTDEETLNTLSQTSPPSEGLGEAYIVIATTRPETIMGDTAICVNPHDPRYKHLKGKKVIVPLINRAIPVIEDDYVDVEFGTGCLKVTPAHDVNDYMLGEKYNLPSIDIFNDNGTLNKNGAQYAGMDRFEVRKQIEKDLEAAGLLEKIEPYTNKVGFSERTNVPIEPKLSMQWFLKMDELAKPALEAVETDVIKFFPPKFKNTYRHWMENIKDWCISRQLWWGHRIPAWYIAPSTSPKGGELPADFPVGGNAFVVALTEQEARMKALEKFPSLKGVREGFSLKQDEDCLDTWFSSWLWPISVFNGINEPGNKDINYYYPTSDLVTGPDIIFFWVARMIMAGYEYRQEPCFQNVYFTGIVRDKLGRKMSKSLGNSPEPLELIEKYGADGVRMGLLLTAPAGNDLPYDDSLCEQGRNFNNKIWNAFRLVKGWEVSPLNSPQGDLQPKASKIAIEWFEAQINKASIEIEDLFSKFRLSEALMTVYKLFWDEFSSWYLEIVKPAYQQPIDSATYKATLAFFDSLLRILHPFMPFITEELWQALEPRKAGESIMVQLQPKPDSIDKNKIAEFEQIKEIIAGIRSIRLQKNIPNKEPLNLIVKGEHNTYYNSIISKLCNLENISNGEATSALSGGLGGASFLVGTTEYAVPMSGLVNPEEEIKKIEAEITYYEGFLSSVLKKLSNEKFVANAKPEIVESERKKQADAEAKLTALKESIAALKG